jgi:putative Mg2+ transporter-C (MgtC) family protein
LGYTCGVIAASTTFALDEDVVIRLVVASALGGLIGVEREASEQAAGLRTHIAVALGACLFGVISTLGFVEFDQLRANSTLQADVTRVASNVVVGIGFLGAGLIFRQGGTIRNLTTAASLWTVAAIGLACGVGDVTTAALATAILLAGLVVLRPIRALIREHWATTSVDVNVRLRSGADPRPLIDQLGRHQDVETTQFAIRKEEDQLVLATSVSAHQAALRRWMAEIADRNDVEVVAEQ